MKKKSSLPWKKVNLTGREKNASKCQPRGHANKQLWDKFEVVIKKWWALMHWSHWLVHRAICVKPWQCLQRMHTLLVHTQAHSPPKFLQQGITGEVSSKTICKNLLYQCDRAQRCFLPEGQGKQPNELTLCSCDAPKAHTLRFLLAFLCKLCKTRKANHNQRV